MRAARVLPTAVGCLLAGCAVVPPQRGGMIADLPAPGSPLSLPAGYAQVWADDFTAGDVPSAKRWHYDTERNRHGWYNGEQQYYARERRENTRLSGGRLIIEARNDGNAVAGFKDYGGQSYTSARLTTRGLASWRHGFFEIRAKLPCARGAWPAIWLMPEHQDVRWQGGEIDIAEAVGYETRSVHHSVQTARRNHLRGNQAQGISRLDYCNAFHDYQLLWTEDQVIIGVDGKVAFSTRPEGFDRPMALILNVAVGGEWGGARGIDSAAFPARMEVEHVRIYRKADT